MEEQETYKVFQNEEQVKQMSALVSRAMMAGGLGMQFDGKRDLYKAFGYNRYPNVNDYWALYDRQGMAARVVDAFADETWRLAPVLVDGTSKSSDESGLTPFLEKWNALNDSLGVYRALHNLDTMCGIGRYAVLFIGAPGDFSQPIQDGQAASIAYLSTFDEGSAKVTEFDRNKASSRYGLPITYSVNAGFETGDSVVESLGTVHYSRVIHAAEHKLRSRVYGRPRLQLAINRLFDLEKVIGGSAEAVWLMVYKGLVFAAREGAQLPDEGTPEYQKLEEAIEQYVHGLRRYLKIGDVDVKDMGSQVVDPQGVYGVLLSDLAGSLAIPQRILIGSERGQLASSQDDANWAGVIEARQQNFIEPEILRPFIDWCVSHKVIPPPSAGKYKIQWRSLFQLNNLEKAELANKSAQAINTISGGVPDAYVDPAQWIERNLDYKE
jgi:hypothetical protein